MYAESRDVTMLKVTLLLHVESRHLKGEVSLWYVYSHHYVERTAVTWLITVLLCWKQWPLYCKYSYQQTESGSIFKLKAVTSLRGKETLIPCWKQSCPDVLSMDVCMLKEELSPCWKNSCLDVLRMTVSMLKEQPSPRWKNSCLDILRTDALTLKEELSQRWK